MKFSLEWLKDHLDTQASVAEIAAALNAIGHEVEGIEDPAERLRGFRVARVLTAARHPDADKLQVLTVDPGDGQPLQVVCGAPNARAGMLGVLGLPGAVVPANGMELRKSAIRGVESNGMMCSTRELELGDDHDGIIELPDDAPVGASFADYHGASPVIGGGAAPGRAAEGRAADRGRPHARAGGHRHAARAVRHARRGGGGFRLNAAHATLRAAMPRAARCTTISSRCRTASRCAGRTARASRCC
ncbi:hypothetical protein J4558_26285 [Leptolyngbya sp. 15MV]|nr:hypothetical protein J4558_26285 [Leptolyngbya sp. 15MV]